MAMLGNAGGMNGKLRAACWENTKVSRSSPARYSGCPMDGGFRLSRCLSCRGRSLCSIVWLCILFFIAWSCMVLAMLENADVMNEESRAACWANTKVSPSSAAKYSGCSINRGFKLSPRFSCRGRSLCSIAWLCILFFTLRCVVKEVKKRAERLIKRARKLCK